MKYLKIFLSLLLVTAIVVSMFGFVNASTEDYYDDYDYDYYDDYYDDYYEKLSYCGAEGDGSNLRWSVEDGVLTIVGSGRMKDYSDEFYSPWHRGHYSGLSLPDGLTNIGSYAFEEASFGESCISIPDSVTEIGDYAFWFCTDLKHVSFGKNLTKIGEAAFAGCIDLNGDLRFPDGLKEIGDSAFYECNRVFGPLVIPDSVETIGLRAFESCHGLSGISLGKGVKTIGELVFLGCYRVSEPIVIPANVTEIGSGAFCGMSQLPAFISENSEYRTIDGTLCSADGKTLISWPGGKSDSFTVPEGVTAIGDLACANCDGLCGTVVIPEGITEIGEFAFNSCNGITGLELPSTLRHIGESAFYDCDKLHGSLQLPKGLETIGPVAFLNDHFTGGLTIPGSVREIGGSAFASCNEFDGELVIEDGVETIGSAAFMGCGFSGTLWIPDSVRVIGDYAFESNTNIGNFAVIGNNVEIIGYGAFSNCVDMDDVYFLGDAPTTYYPEDYLSDPENYYQPVPLPFDCSRLHYLAGTKGWTDSEAYNAEAGTFWDCPICVYDDVFARPFRDVAPCQYYTAPIAWAAGEKITTGKTELKFEPEASCTRGQMVTFLWRAAGCPEPETAQCPFNDVSMDAYYAKAILWASENGIVNGMGDGKFAPDKTVTRGQMATILYRYFDGRAEGANPFTDVVPDAYYYDAVRWAYAAGITTGKTASTFGPDSPCTRAQIVTFLCRAFTGKA